MYKTYTWACTCIHTHTHYCSRAAENETQADFRIFRVLDTCAAESEIPPLLLSRILIVLKDSVFSVTVTYCSLVNSQQGCSIDSDFTKVSCYC